MIFWLPGTDSRIESWVDELLFIFRIQNKRITIIKWWCFPLRYGHALRLKFNCDRNDDDGHGVVKLSLMISVSYLLGITF